MWPLLLKSEFKTAFIRNDKKFDKSVIKMSDIKNLIEKTLIKMLGFINGGLTPEPFVKEEW